MACTTLTPDVQGCLNIPLIRGDDKAVELLFWSDELNTVPLDISVYDILMQVRQQDKWQLVSSKVPGAGLTVSGNSLTIIFDEDDPVYLCLYRVLNYDIAFTANDVTQHWIKGQIIITKSEADTWT